MKVIIIGAGFTGTMIAVHLAREATSAMEVTLVERRSAFATGLAYSTRHACHLLNVPAGRMSALPEQPDHFLQWAAARNPSVHGGTFLPRQLYGEYLRQLLDQARLIEPRYVKIDRMAAEAVAVRAIDGGRFEVRLADGRSSISDAMVLAIGNYPPADPPCETMEFYASDLYRQDPWADGALKIDERSSVLLLGTGLTMVDVAVALHHQGHKGRICCLSRRGLLPQSHREAPEGTAPRHLDPPKSIDQWPRTARGVLRAIRNEVNAAARNGFDWREVLTSLRSVTQALWMTLPQQERRRFLRHLRPYWESHRHRAAPEVARTINHMRDQGQLKVIAGRLRGYDMAGQEIHVRVCRRGTNVMETIRVACVINCTGPDTDLSRVRDPLVQSLRAQGMIRPDALGLGLDTDEVGRVIDRNGIVQPRLFLVGPLRRGLLWESIAVPELRKDAQRVARHLLSHRNAIAATALA